MGLYPIDVVPNPQHKAKPNNLSLNDNFGKQLSLSSALDII